MLKTSVLLSSAVLTRVQEQSSLYLSLSLPCCFIMAQPSVFTGKPVSTSLHKQSFLWRALRGFTVFMLRFHNWPVFTDTGGRRAHIQHHIKEIQLSWDRNDPSTEPEGRHTDQARNSGISVKSAAGAGMLVPLQVRGSHEPLYLCDGLLLCVLCV